MSTTHTVIDEVLDARLRSSGCVPVFSARVRRLTTHGVFVPRILVITVDGALMLFDDDRPKKPTKDKKQATRDPKISRFEMLFRPGVLHSVHLIDGAKGGDGGSQVVLWFQADRDLALDFAPLPEKNGQLKDGEARNAAASIGAQLRRQFMESVEHVIPRNVRVSRHDPSTDAIPGEKRNEKGKEAAAKSLKKRPVIVRLATHLDKKGKEVGHGSIASNDLIEPAPPLINSDSQPSLSPAPTANRRAVSSAEDVVQQPGGEQNESPPLSSSSGVPLEEQSKQQKGRGHWGALSNVVKATSAIAKRVRSFSGKSDDHAATVIGKTHRSDHNPIGKTHRSDHNPPTSNSKGRGDSIRDEDHMIVSPQSPRRYSAAIGEGTAYLRRIDEQGTVLQQAWNTHAGAGRETWKLLSALQRRWLARNALVHHKVLSELIEHACRRQRQKQQLLHQNHEEKQAIDWWRRCRREGDPRMHLSFDNLRGLSSLQHRGSQGRDFDGSTTLSSVAPWDTSSANLVHSRVKQHPQQQQLDSYMTTSIVAANGGILHGSFGTTTILGDDLHRQYQPTGCSSPARFPVELL